MATKKLGADLAQEIATTGDGRDITQPWLTQLREPCDRRLLGSVDWGAYEVIRKDDRVKSCMAQRILAVISAEWDVLAGDDADPRSVKAAEVLKNNLAEISLDQLTEKMLWANFYGIQIGEVIWQSPGERQDNHVGIAAIKVRHGRRFRYDKDMALRLITRGAPNGEILPERKFWQLSVGATNDDEPYGEGLADWLYWPVFFKRNAVRFWNIFLKKFGNPTAKATYRRGTPQADIRKALSMIQAMSEDSGFVVPEGIAVELLQAARSGTADYATIYDKMDSAIATIILSQTMTTQDGSSNAQAQVHAGVKLEIVKADADIVCESFNAGPSRWWTDLNYSPDVAAPRLVRLVEEEADLKLLAETDAILSSQGWVRSDESFQDTYGDGYERREQTAGGSLPSDVPAATAKGRKVANDDPAPKPEENPIEPQSVASFAELQGGDVVDQLVADLLEEQGWRPLSPQLKAIINAIEASDSPESLDEALLQSLDSADAMALTQILARTTFTARVAAQLGEDE